MAAGGVVDSLERLTQDVFEVVKHLALASPRGRRRPGDLKEGEFLTLAMLQGRGTLTVGEMQRVLGVLPAQMSRIIRSLESHARPLIACRINPLDKRKVDVTITPEGEQVLGEYRRHRIGRIQDVLRQLSEDDLERLAAVIDRVRHILRRRNGT